MNRFYTLLVSFFTMLLLSSEGQVHASEVFLKNLLPKPQQVELSDEKVACSGFVVGQNDFKGAINFAVALPEIKVIEGLRTKLAKHRFCLQLCKVDKISEAWKYGADEGYRLIVNDDKTVRIEASTARGAFWGLQTLHQLCTACAPHKKDNQEFYLPKGKIVDYPAFPIRGFMNDCGRTYIPMEELKREIDVLARHKMNVFHWHLTENLGWRLESKLYPQLNDPKTYERMPGQFYTFEEAKELVQYCKDRHVILIPEIDMPGHSLAFRKAFKKDMQNPEGMKILQALIKEAIEEVFSDHETVPYFHIGTDEVHITNKTFVPEMVAFIRGLGKKVVTWNPGAHYKPGEIDMVQMWSSRGKPLPGTPSVDCRFHYINHYDAFADLALLYFGQVYAKPLADDTIAGAILAIWHDRYVADLQELLATNGFYPHILTTAEALWQGQRTQSALKRGMKIPLEGKELDEFADFEKRLLTRRHLLKQQYSDMPFIYVPQAGMKWRITEPFPNQGDFNRIFPPESEQDKKSFAYEGKTYHTFEALGATIYLRHTWGDWTCGYYRGAKPNHTAYASTYIYSPSEREVGLYVNTQNYSRSEPDLPPPQGKWDYHNSQFYLNGETIAPPTWTNTHTNKSNEITLRNENFEARPPIKARLKKGWNKVLIKLPMGNFSRREIRLVKWMFTFAVVTPEGEPIYDLIYEPDPDKFRLKK